jgi:hypothetical protein
MITEERKTAFAIAGMRAHVAEVEAEIKRLEVGPVTIRAAASRVMRKANRVLSKKGSENIAAAQRKRWAAFRKAKKKR